MSWSGNGSRRPCRNALLESSDCFSELQFRRVPLRDVLRGKKARARSVRFELFLLRCYLGGVPGLQKERCRKSHQRTRSPKRRATKSWTPLFIPLPWWERTGRQPAENRIAKERWPVVHRRNTVRRTGNCLCQADNILDVLFRIDAREHVCPASRRLKGHHNGAATRGKTGHGRNLQRARAGIDQFRETIAKNGAGAGRGYAFRPGFGIVVCAASFTDRDGCDCGRASKGAGLRHQAGASVSPRDQT